MNTPIVDRPIELSGRYLHSTVAAMHEFRELGEAVLNRYNISTIELEKYYLASLRRSMLLEVRERFGDEGVMYVAAEGVRDIAGGALSGIIPKATLDGMQLAIKKGWDSESVLLQRTCDEFVAAWINMADRTVDATHRNHKFRPWRFEKSGALTYRLIQQVTITPALHWNTYGQIHGLLHLLLPDGIDFRVQFIQEQSQCFGEYSELVFDFRFIPFEDLQSHADILRKTRSSLREQIFSKALHYALKQEAVAKDALKQRDEAFAITESSIRYARFIQHAQLPGNDRKIGRFRELKLCWEPRDTIGGDLWWISPKSNSESFTIVLADCTGHGVPGAMLSTLLAGLLERVYSSEPDLDPTIAYRDLKRSFNQTFQSDEANERYGIEDGFEAAIVQVFPRRQEIRITGEGIGIIVANRKALRRVHLRRYHDNTQVLRYEQSDIFILYSDGLSEQPGINEAGRRRLFGNQRLTNIIQRYIAYSPAELTTKIYDHWLSWIGHERRVDDLTLACFQLEQANS